MSNNSAHKDCECSKKNLAQTFPHFFQTKAKQLQVTKKWSLTHIKNMPLFHQVEDGGETPFLYIIQ